MTAAGWKNLPAWVLNEFGVRQDAAWLVRIPDRTVEGRLYAERVVAPSGRRWWEPGDGRPVIPFGLDRLEDPAFRKYRALAITEGETDALALSAALGAEGLDVLGVPGSNTWRDAWAEHADGYATVFVLGDGDASGRRLNQKVKRALPAALIVDLPAGDDVRAVAQRNVDELLALIDAAERKQALSNAFFSADSLTELERVAA